MGRGGGCRRYIFTMDAMEHFDVCIAGAGIIGLSLALELRSRGRTVVVLERGNAVSESSWAAAGMLAADDPDNPPALAPLAELSISMYPEFLNRIRSLSGLPVPIRTRQTLQKSPALRPHPSSLPGSECLPCSVQRVHFRKELRSLEPALADSVSPGLSSHRMNQTWFLLNELSLDPRDVCMALRTSAERTAIEMRECTEWLPPARASHHGNVASLRIATSRRTFDTAILIDCRGAWASHTGNKLNPLERTSIRPVKGQALTVALPSGLSISRTIRSPGIYLVPRGDGRVVIGATVEEAGFDKSTDEASISALIARADALLPGIAKGTVLECWAGLRPGTPDGLPLLGAVSGSEIASIEGRFIAAGHYRNGILLAPATALVMAQLVCAEAPSIDLAPFSPARFQSTVGQG